MSEPVFLSELADQFRGFIDFKRAQQFDYSACAVQLHFFDLFLKEQGWAQPLLTKILFASYQKHIAGLLENTRYTRLSVVREFSRYLHLYNKESALFNEIEIGRPPAEKAYIYSDQDIVTLTKEAGRLRPSTTDPLRPLNYRMLITFLLVTGLRISEALSLKLDHLHEHNQIFIHRGKFAKDRLIVLTDSTVKVLSQFLVRRATLPGAAESNSLFLGRDGLLLTYSAVKNTFRGLISRTHIGDSWTGRPPRIHDLRYTFATRKLIQWYREGKPLHAMLAVLATYMGHVNVHSTQIYLQTTPELLCLAGERFHEYVSQSIVPSGGES